MRLAVIVTVLAGLAAGCSGVRPYQREQLAKPKMQFDANPDATLLQQHVYEYREGASGGYGGGGGGCGCN